MHPHEEALVDHINHPVVPTLPGRFARYQDRIYNDASKLEAFDAIGQESQLGPTLEVDMRHVDNSGLEHKAVVTVSSGELDQDLSMPQYTQPATQSRLECEVSDVAALANSVVAVTRFHHYEPVHRATAGEAESFHETTGAIAQPKSSKISDSHDNHIEDTNVSGGVLVKNLRKLSELKPTTQIEKKASNEALVKNLRTLSQSPTIRYQINELHSCKEDLTRFLLDAHRSSFSSNDSESIADQIEPCTKTLSGQLQKIKHDHTKEIRVLSNRIGVIEKTRYEQEKTIAESSKANVKLGLERDDVKWKNAVLVKELRQVQDRYLVLSLLFWFILIVFGALLQSGSWS